MRRVRRDSEGVRVEMTPLIDVVFLLIIFFIFSLLVSVRAELLPVQLAPVGTGEAVEPIDLVALTIDAKGDFYLNRDPIEESKLDTWLAEYAEQSLETRPRLYVAMQEAVSLPDDESDADSESQTNVVDRGPMLIALINRLRKAGITDFAFIGDPI